MRFLGATDHWSLLWASHWLSTVLARSLLWPWRLLSCQDISIVNPAPLQTLHDELVELQILSMKVSKCSQVIQRVGRRWCRVWRLVFTKVVLLSCLVFFIVALFVWLSKLGYIFRSIFPPRMSPRLPTLWKLGFFLVFSFFFLSIWGLRRWHLAINDACLIKNLRYRLLKILYLVMAD